MLGLVSAACETFANLIWLCSESSLIFGEFFSPPLRCLEAYSMHLNGGYTVSHNDVSYGDFRLRTAIRSNWNGLSGFQCISMENGVSQNNVFTERFF